MLATLDSVQALEPLAVDAPLAIEIIHTAAQGPTGAYFLHRHVAADFAGELLGPHAGGAPALEEFLAVVDDGGIEYGHGEYSHCFLLVREYSALSSSYFADDRSPRGGMKSKKPLIIWQDDQRPAELPLD